MFLCAGKMESFAFAQTIGVGLVECALHLTQLVLQKNPEILIFIGSAGSYDPTLPLLGVFEANAATQIELSLWEKKSYTPLENVIVAGDSPLGGICVNSSNYITTDSNLALQFLERGIAYENMEFFSVLRVAQHFKIPVFGIFCITNYANENAHEDFMANFKLSNAKLESYIKEHYAQYL
ncbi:MAG: purine-nucleoside phosphorylase [Helicobacter sp.]|nr:purine-nucleoside phosphorylase [Helicobacter sp.]